MAASEDRAGRIPAGIWQREIEGTKAYDEQEAITLDWNEILGAKKTGWCADCGAAGSRRARKKRPGAHLVQDDRFGRSGALARDASCMSSDWRRPNPCWRHSGRGQSRCVLPKPSPTNRQRALPE